MPPPGEGRDELPEPRPLPRVEPDAGLVQQQHRGAREQADRDVDPLLVAAGEPSDDVTPPLPQSGQLEHLLDRRARLLVLLQAGKQQQVLLHRQPPVERRLLRHPAHVPVGRADLSLVRLDGPGQDREQGRLAGPVGTDDRDKLPRLGSEVDPPQRFAARRTRLTSPRASTAGTLLAS